MKRIIHQVVRQHGGKNGSFLSFRADRVQFCGTTEFVGLPSHKITKKEKRVDEEEKKIRTCSPYPIVLFTSRATVKRCGVWTKGGRTERPPKREEKRGRRVETRQQGVSRSCCANANFHRAPPNPTRGLNIRHGRPPHPTPLQSPFPIPLTSIVSP